MLSIKKRCFLSPLLRLYFMVLCVGWCANVVYFVSAVLCWWHFSPTCLTGRVHFAPLVVVALHLIMSALSSWFTHLLPSAVRALHVPPLTVVALHVLRGAVAMSGVCT